MRNWMDGWAVRGLGVTTLTLGVALACGDESDSGQNAAAGGASGSGGGGTGNDAGNDVDAGSVAAEKDDVAFLEAIALVKDTLEAHPEIWPGYEFPGVPVYGVDVGRRQLALHSSVSGYPELSGLSAQTSASLGPVYVVDGALDSFDGGQGFARYQLTGDAPGFAIAFPFGKNVVGQTLPAAQERGLMAGVSVHELFHVHQDKWSLDYEPNGCGFPLDDDTLGWGWIEHLALAEAVKGATSLDRLRDALVARLARNAAEADIVDVEDYWEATEGTANLVQLSFLELAGIGPPVETALGASLPGDVDITEFGRNRHYEIGAAIAYVLDRNGKSFRTELESGGRLHDIAADALGLDTPTAQAELPAILTEYQYDTQVLPAIQSARDAYVAARDQLVQAFTAPTGRIVRFTVPPGSLQSLAYQKMYGMTDCSTYYSAASIYFELPKLQGSATNQAALHASESDAVWEFVSASEPSLKLDGAVAPFANGSYSFTELDIQAPGWELHTQLPGTLLISDTEVSIVVSG